LTRKRALIALAVLVVLTLAIVLVMRRRVRRARVTHPAAAEAKREVPAGLPPVEQWTSIFARLEGDELAALLTQIEQKHPDLYKQWSLGYLHARALIDANEDADALKKLAPFLARDNPFRELALYHRSQILEGEAASRDRLALIEEFPHSQYREEAIEDEIEYLDDAQRLADFAAKVAPSAPTDLRREMSARIVEVNPDAGLARGLLLLQGGTTDDASDRVARALDKPELLRRMNVQQWATLGETLQNHRHFDRAIAILGMALHSVYSDDLQFALGRSYYGGEKYEEAQAAYLRGANATKNLGQKTQFYWHAARSAQLRGDDATAERLMTQAIAVKGKYPATTPAITQRMRTRLHQHRYAEAASDLALLRKLAPNEHAIVEGSLAYALAMLAAGKRAAALSTLNSVPPKLLTDADEEELAYWKHKGEPQPATDLKKLESMYRERPAYRAVLELKPEALPSFPLKAADRDTLLMAMGLEGEAVDAIEKRWPLKPARSALTRALALNRGGAAHESIYAVEVMMKSVPRDFHPDLLPPVVQQLLYPRYFYNFVLEDAKKYDADPALVLAIMREESRFNPRAKSQAAARGLLQFIITTARDIGRDIGLVDVDPADLYDPRIIIRLGAKYISELSETFAGNRYRATAAYNAGPKQVALWTRLQPAPGDDYFVSAINFDETKAYVKKVMRSYERYRATR
jgi:soluble lytic murein transglycosylase-like protein